MEAPAFFEQIKRRESKTARPALSDRCKRESKTAPRAAGLYTGHLVLFLSLRLLSMQ